MLMNRRSDDVESLLALAREAVHDEEYADAVMHLRQAHSLAPLRQDIRQLLATILENTSVEAMPPPEPEPFAATREPDEYEEEEEAVALPVQPPHVHVAEERAPASRPDFRASALMGRTSASRRAIDDVDEAEVAEDPADADECPRPERFAARPFVDGLRARMFPRTKPELAPAVLREARADEEYEVPEEDEDYDDAPRPGLLRSFAIRISRRREEASAAAAGAPHRVTRSAAALQDEDDGTFRLYSELAARNPKREDKRDEEMPAPAQPARRSRKSLPPEDEEPADEPLFVTHRLAAQAIAYLLILSFFGVSSGVSYVKFFRPEQLSMAEQPSKAEKQALAKVDKATGAKTGTSKSSKTDEEVLRLGGEYIERGRIDDAIAMLEGALRSAGSVQQGKITELLASAYDTKGTKLLESNDLEKSAEFYQKARDLKPTRADYSVHLGNAYWYCGTLLAQNKSAGYLQKAADALTRAIELDRKNVLAYQRLATVYESLKQNKQAREAWVKIREIAPQSSEAELAQERLKTLSMAE
jgi:tetratricopeptide (TPR) repeat protein